MRKLQMKSAVGKDVREMAVLRLLAMVRLIALAAGLALSLAAGREAWSGPLPFTGSISARIDFVRPGLPPLIVGATGAGTAAVGTNGAGHILNLALGGGEFATAGLVFVPSPATPGIKGVQFTASNGAGAFARTPTAMSPLGGVMPLNGIAKVCLFAPCASAVGNITVPLNVVGAGGAAAASTASGNVGVTVLGAPWTTGAAAVGTISGMGFAHGPASATSSTANPSGVVQLVTPVFVSTNLTGPGLGFATMDLHFIPEPATLTLLGFGVVGLVLAGRSRRGGTGRLGLRS